MTPERWQQMKELLDHALEHAPADRAAWLARTCDDEALRRQLDAYLAFDEQSLDFMEEPAISLLASEPDAVAPGQHIGPYRILRRLGRGGAGTVYLALREHGFTKEVAIKVLDRGANSDEIVRRFEQERQILAQLEHPGIARLLDGGSTADGLPYFVLERVEGERLDHYCVRHQLSLRERLVLFRRVCSAVAFAHRNLIVHRDLKPSNILVTVEGEPKLLDFGIAKLLDSASPSTDELAGAEKLRPMTLAYASPEQILGQTVTTATDIYSLGALLWELLTGQRLHASGHAQAIRGEDVPPPSTAPDLGKLQRRLRGDLDHIVLKALAREPGDRYSSVEQLSADIERHLTERPVLARPATFAYVGGRFLRRHWVALSVAAAFFLVGLGFGVHARMQAIELARSLRVSEQIAGILGEVFTSFDPYGESTEEERLDRGLEDIRPLLVDQPQLETQVLQAIAFAYGGLGKYQKAVDLSRQIVELREVRWGKAHPAVAEGYVNLSAALLRLDELDEAEVVLREGLTILKRLHGDDHPDVFSSEHNLAVLLKKLGHHDEAEKLYRGLIERRKLYGDELGVATEMYNLGVLLYAKEQLDEAEGLYRNALEIRERLLPRGASHPAVATILGSYGMLLLKDDERRGEAEQVLTRALDIVSQTLPENHRDVAAGHYRLAQLFDAQGRVEEAERHFRETVERARQGLPTGHRDLSTFLIGAAAFLAREGQFGDAEGLAREALHNLSAVSETSASWKFAEARSVLGLCLAGRQRFVEAEELLLDSHAVLERERGAGDRRAREALERIVRFYEMWGKPGEGARFRS